MDCTCGKAKKIEPREVIAKCCKCSGVLVVPWADARKKLESDLRKEIEAEVLEKIAMQTRLDNVARQRQLAQGAALPGDARAKRCAWAFHLEARLSGGPEALERAQAAVVARFGVDGAAAWVAVVGTTRTP